MKVLAVILVAVVGVVLAYRLAFPTYHQRYKLVAEIEHRGQALKEEGVYDVTWKTQPRFSQGGFSNIIKGRGPIFDLGEDGVVIFMNSPSGVMGDYSIDAHSLLFGPFGLISDRRDIHITPEVLRGFERLSGSSAVSPEWMPQVVWLPNPGQASTARPIKAAEFWRISGSTKLISLTAQITSEKVPQPLQENVPWVRQSKENEARGPSRREFSLTYSFIEGV